MTDTPLVATPKTLAIPSAFGALLRLSAAERIALVFFVYIAVAALVFDISSRDLGMLVALSVVTFATLVALRRNRSRAPWIAIAADLFPALLILVAYRESGLLLTGDPSHHLDFVFIQWDRRLLHTPLVQAVLQAGAPWLQHYLELAYLLCYPLVPMGALAVHFASRGDVTPPFWRRAPAGSRRYATGAGMSAIDSFWTTVLMATLFCYAVYPFFPLTPPRVLFGDVPGPHVEPLLRQWNFWLLNHYSVNACMFPSGHVAAVTAVALALRKQAPRIAAWFLFLAASVALATVYGRYHYSADALAGALVAVAAYKASQLIR